MVIVIARVRPRPDRREELLALLREVQEASRRDDGCLNYGYYEELADPDALIAVEEWRDGDALAAHLRRPHVAKLVQALPDLVAAAPEIAAHEVARSGPLPLP
jgi:quinol monooxygenase YgiN